jgi:hypothetical protein
MFLDRIQKAISSLSIKFLLAFFFGILSLLIVQAIGNSRDINDAWILEGVFVPFLLLTIVYAAITSFSPSIKMVVITTSIYLAAINVLPCIKYPFIYGYHDPLLHFASIKETIAASRVVEVGPYSVQYGATPGTHILVSILSLVTGFDIVDAIKTFLIFLPLSLPSVVYMTMNKLDFPNGLKRTVIASIPITTPITYTYFGASAVYPLYVLLICFCLLFACRRKSSRSEVAVALVLSAAILISHDVTSFLLLGFTLILLALIGVETKKVFYTTARPPVLFFLVFITMAFAHFSFSSSINNFMQISSLIKEVVSRLTMGESPVAFSHYSFSFYQLTLFDIVQILIIRFANIAISLILVLIAPFAIMRLRFREKRLQKSEKFYRILTPPFIFALVVFISLFFLRSVTHREFYMAAFFPFLAGVSIYYVFYSKHYKFKNLVLTTVIFVLIVISSFSIYPIQPLMPSFSTDQGAYYVLDMREVTTVYDRSLILFVNVHTVRYIVWADVIMTGQIRALTNPSFQSLLTSDHNKAALLMLGHTAYSHTIPSGRDALANEQYLMNALQQTGVLYTNGPSYALLNGSMIEGAGMRSP